MPSICNTLISIGLLQVATTSQCLAMEFEASTIPSQDQLLRLAVKKVSKSLQGNARLSQSRFAKNFTASVLKTKGEVGRELLGQPIQVKLDLAARPAGLLQQLKVEPVVDLRASRTLTPSIPGSVELLVSPRVDSESSVKVLYRFSF